MPTYVYLTPFWSGVLKGAMNNKKLGFDKEILARRIVPFLLYLAIEPGLNETQVCSLHSCEHPDYIEF